MSDETLNYSSAAAVRRRESDIERQHREATAVYNEATFGERHPVASTFLRIACLGVVAVMLVWLFPRTIVRFVGIVLAVAYVAWRAYQRVKEQ